MNGVVHDAYQRKLQEIAADYRAQGYDVRIEPGPKEVPAFLAGFRPDLIARGPHDSVVVEVKVGTATAASERFRELAEMIREQPGWRFSLVVIDPRSDEVAPLTQPLLNRQAIAYRLERANELLRTGLTDAAFLLFWVSTEALLRQLASREGLPLERFPSSTLLKELFSLGILSRDDLEVAQRALAVRNALVHGFEATGLDQTADELAQLAQRLLAELDQRMA
jgi:hypothetical protein